MSEKITAASKITSAVVYADRAIIKRTAKVEIVAGENEILFEKLPPELQGASVQVAARGVAGTAILDVTTKTGRAAESTSGPRVKALQDEILPLESTLAELTARGELLNNRQRLLEKIEDALAAPPAKGATVFPDIDALKQLFSFAGDTRAKISGERLALAREQEDTTKKRKTLQAQLNDILRGEQARSDFKNVAVRVAAGAAGTLEVEIACTIFGVCWEPAYDVRLRAEERAVEISYFGVVRQGTGEDWSDVALTLSTARPALGGEAPALTPWILDTKAPRIFAGRMEESKILCCSEPHVDFADAKTDEDDESYYARSEVENGVTGAVFKIAAPATIPGDNSAQKVCITTGKLAAELHYFAVPELREIAYLIAETSNTTAFPFLAGRANIFNGDTFVSSTRLKTVMPAEKFEISLGADESIAVERRDVKRFSENTGLTGKGRRTTYEFSVTITNNKSTPARVIFEEMLPVSRNEKIVVNMLLPAEKEIGTPEKPGREVTRQEGNKLAWTLALAAGEKREIPVKFSLEHPAEVEVFGLK